MTYLSLIIIPYSSEMETPTKDDITSVFKKLKYIAGNKVSMLKRHI